MNRRIGVRKLYLRIVQNIIHIDSPEVELLDSATEHKNGRCLQVTFKYTSTLVCF